MNILRFLNPQDLLNLLCSSTKFSKIKDNNLWASHLPKQSIILASQYGITNFEMFRYELLDFNIPMPIRILILSGHLTLAEWKSIAGMQLTIICSEIYLILDTPEIKRKIIEHGIFTKIVYSGYTVDNIPIFMKSKVLLAAVVSGLIKSNEIISISRFMAIKVFLKEPWELLRNLLKMPFNQAVNVEILKLKQEI